MAGIVSSEDHVKDPNALLDYSIDWYDWLNPLGDQILTSTWVATPGITITTDTNTLTNTTVWLEGGVQGVYRVTNTIETLGGRRDERSLTIRVQER
jgi:hypothetical protein